MFPPQFGYRRAGSVDEAVDLLSKFTERDVRVLAGGHGLLPEVKRGDEAPDVLVDIGGIDGLRYVDADDSGIEIGALTTYADVARSEPLWARAPAFAEAVAGVGDVQIRNRGTVGGNLAQADPRADPPAAALVSEAVIDVRGSDGERGIDVADFLRGDGETAVATDEIVTAVRLPYTDDTGGAYVKKTHPASGYAMIGVAAAVEIGDDTVTDTRVAVNGVTDPPTRLPSVEKALIGEATEATSAATAADHAADDLDPDDALSEPYASGEFRVATLAPYVAQALETAIERATTGATLEPDDGLGLLGGDGR